MHDTNTADGKKVVIQNGQRVTPAIDEQAAQQEAARRNKLQEAAGQKNENSQAQVKTNLYG